MEPIKKIVKEGWGGVQGYVYLPKTMEGKEIIVINPETGEIIKTGKITAQKRSGSGKMFLHKSFIGKELEFRCEE